MKMTKIGRLSPPKYRECDIVRKEKQSSNGGSRMTTGQPTFDGWYVYQHCIRETVALCTLKATWTQKSCYGAVLSIRHCKKASIEEGKSKCAVLYICSTRRRSMRNHLALHFTARVKSIVFAIVWLSWPPKGTRFSFAGSFRLPDLLSRWPREHDSWKTSEAKTIRAG